MFHIETDEFQKLMETAISRLPSDHRDAIRNVGFFVRDRPSDEQAERAGLQHGYLLLGLYEGVPLSARLGSTPLMPDKITLFQESIEYVCQTYEQLVEQIGKTVWHEVAHYFGLNHDDIRKLE